MVATLLAALAVAQIEIVTPGEPVGIAPIGFLDPPIVDGGVVQAPAAPPADRAAAPSDAGAAFAGQTDVGQTDAGAADAGEPAPLLPPTLKDQAEAAVAAARRAAEAAAAAQAAADRATARWHEAAGGTSRSNNNQGWGGSANLNLIAFSGNVESVTLSLGGTLSKIFPNGWIAALRLVGNYGEARVPGTPQSQLTALSGSFQARADKLYARSATVYALGGLDSDHVDSLELRAYGEPGTALFWFDRRQGDLEKLLLRTDFGFRYAHESRFQYFPTQMVLGEVQFAGPRLGMAFHVAASKDVGFQQEGEVLRDLGSRRTIANTSTKVMAHLIKQFFLTASFLVGYDSAPPLSRLTTDTALTVGIEVKF